MNHHVAQQVVRKWKFLDTGSGCVSQKSVELYLWICICVYKRQTINVISMQRYLVVGFKTRMAHLEGQKRGNTGMRPAKQVTPKPKMPDLATTHTIHANWRR